MISSDFYTWLLDNQCLFNHERFKPFIDNCIEDLTVNGYGEETIMSFLRLWDCYQNSKEWAV